MKRLVLLITLLLGNVYAQDVVRYPNPARFDNAIAQFEGEDRNNPPPAGAVLCIGSSSMRMWHDMIEQDLAPLKLIKRGFGGSNMNDVLHYADRIVLPYKPRAIVLYEGDNDAAKGIPAAKILETFRALVAKVHAAQPDCRFYVLPAKPSPSRWHLWPAMQEANNLIAGECAKDGRMTFVDIASPMLSADGTPIPELFKKDQLHMNRAGYEIWRNTLRPVLHKAEGPFESGTGVQTIMRFPESIHAQTSGRSGSNAFLCKLR
jgi:lysophospholipase L1-like esterase